MLESPDGAAGAAAAAALRGSSPTGLMPCVSQGRAPPPDAAAGLAGAEPKERLVADEEAAPEDAAAGDEIPNEGAAEDAELVDGFAAPKPPKPPPKPGVEPAAAAGANPKDGAAFFSSFAGNAAAAAAPLLPSALEAAAGGGAPNVKPPPVEAAVDDAAAPKMPPPPPNIPGFAAAAVPADAAGAAPNAGAGACERMHVASAFSRPEPHGACNQFDKRDNGAEGKGAHVSTRVPGHVDV